jgi:hypothetical protein
VLSRFGLFLTPDQLTARLALRRRGVETKLVLPGLAQQKHSSRCDPVLIKAILRGRAWFEELASGRARSLQELARRDGISRRYIRRLVCPRLPEPGAGRGELTGSATHRTHRDASHRTRSAARLDRATHTARELNRKLADSPQAAATTAAGASSQSGLSFPEVGLHQCRSEKNGQGLPTNGQPVPSHVPVHPQTAAKAAPLASSVHASPQRQTPRWSEGTSHQ